MSGETRYLAEYIFDIQYKKFSKEVIEQTKLCVEDLFGVAVAGSKGKEAGIWKKYYASRQQANEAFTLEKDFPWYSAESAAALNAVYGHSLDFDDVHNTSITHLGVVTIPAAFATAQKLHKSGKDFLEAIVAGYEAGARIGEAINPYAYRFWHTTGVVGAFSSGIACGKLLGLDVEGLINCMGSAGTQAAGLWEFLRNGSMSKVLHTANANLCGMRAAELSLLGFSGADTILEGERGFIKALAEQYDLESLTGMHAEGYQIMRNSLKPYACCRHIHSSYYALEKILAEETFSYEQVKEVFAYTYKTAVDTIDNSYPENAYAAKFSLQFCIASGLILKDFGMNVFKESNIKRADIQNMMKRIYVKEDKALQEVFLRDSSKWPHRLEIFLDDGRKLVKEIEYPLGDFQNPFDQDVADRKFLALTRDILTAGQRNMLLKCLHRLEEIDDMANLFDMVS